MPYKVELKRTVLVGSKKIAGGKIIPSAIEREIGEKNIESLLKDHAISEVKESPIEHEIEEQDNGNLELDKMGMRKLRSIAKDIGINPDGYEGKDDLIAAINRKTGNA